LIIILNPIYMNNDVIVLRLYHLRYKNYFLTRPYFIVYISEKHWQKLPPWLILIIMLYQYFPVYHVAQMSPGRWFTKINNPYLEGYLYIIQKSNISIKQISLSDFHNDWADRLAKTGAASTSKQIHINSNYKHINQGYISWDIPS